MPESPRSGRMNLGRRFIACAAIHHTDDENDSHKIPHKFFNGCAT